MKIYSYKAPYSFEEINFVDAKTGVVGLSESHAASNYFWKEI